MEKQGPLYVGVVLPLPLAETYTYRLPAALKERVQAGCRVVVPFGARKIYTAFVVETGCNAPEGGFTVKDVMDVLDSRPLLLPSQLRFWRWMARYYLCTLGEVCRAALPAGLKMESESVVGLNPDYDTGRSLSAREEAVLAALSDGHEHTVTDLQRTLGTQGILPTVRTLYECGAVRLKEELRARYRPRTETHVRLCAALCREDAMRPLSILLARSKMQTRLLSVYMRLSEAQAAIRLQNPALLKEVSKAVLLEEAGTGNSVLTALREKKILETYAFETGRLEHALMPDAPLGKSLNGAQQKAEDEVREAFLHHNVCLLHGVTGSGKTEIYIDLMRRELAAGRQVLYLLPEIALTTQITQRLSRVFGNRMGVYHSKFPDSVRVEVWKKQTGEAPYDIILGVRSSLFLPFRNLGLIIVDEEHETSYKQQDPAPRYHARDTAVMLGSMLGAKVLLGTATPSLESYTNARSGKYALVELQERYGGLSLPEIRVQDLASLRRRKLMGAQALAPDLVDEMGRTLGEGGQVILFKNRRGYAPVLECHACGWVPRCEHCDVSLTYHREQNRLVCHYCGAQYALPDACPKCGERHLRDHGYGTEKVEEEVRALFPEARVARMDLDTTRGRHAYEDIIENFRQGHTDVLIGTQMVSKGLDFDRVRVVGILDADALLNVPDFRSYERAFQMMAQVAGRAGRKDSRGLVMLQTSQPDADIVCQVVGNSYGQMYETQMRERGLFGFPPFCKLIYIYVKDRHAATAERAAQALARALRPAFGDRLLGPQAPPVARIQSLYIRMLVLKADARTSPDAVRGLLLSAAREVQQSLRSTVYFDVDPL